ncbi:cytochrome c [Vibrio mimicus]|uniref:c-type cytochrome n=1 Tax=Vibrio sp. RC586 TaxID=675815 RepID=UPI0001BB7EB6|nr:MULTISPECIES: cytochrome c [Vibrio]EEY99450.1 cytochrome c553 [Vibrio sp. RC586]QXC55974.1 cytochrome c [Vibrio mimicus]
MRLIFPLLCLSIISTPLLASGDPVLGQQKAPSCVFCHGSNGKATQPSYPNLNNQNELYLYNAMKAYQNGEKTGPMAEMMKAQLQRLNDQDLRDVAAFYASQP